MADADRTGELLTEAEHRAMDLTVELVRTLAEIVGPDRSRGGDMAELVAAVHAIQQSVMSQAAARAYPERYRLLGEILRAGGVLIVADTDRHAEGERHRQAAHLYSIIQSAENSEDGGPTTDVERAFDAGIMYAARNVLENWAGSNDDTADLVEYADEIRARCAPGTPLPYGERTVFERALEWREAVAYRSEYGNNGEDVGRAELALCGAIDALAGEDVDGG